MDGTTFSRGDASLHVHRWVPEDARAACLIIHGIAEHGARYARLADELSGHGFAVYAPDLRGHGLSAREGSYGHLADDDGWNAVVGDLEALVAKLRADHEGQPLVVIGHSMGSFLAQELMTRVPLDGVVLSGSNGPLAGVDALGPLVARVARRLSGKRGHSRIIQRMTFEKYNKPFEPGLNEFEWLTRDMDAQQAYIDDPLCGFEATTQTWRDMMVAYQDLHTPERLAAIPDHLPVYVFCGDHDLVSDGGRGVQRLLDAYQGAGLTNVSFRVYPEGRHEMLNELNWREVHRDLIGWLDEVVPSEARESA